MFLRRGTGPVGCADGSVNPVSPSASPVIASLAVSAFLRSGDLHVTKECSAYTGAAGDVCTITSSNVKEIAVGSKVVYARAANFSTLSLDSDVVLDLPTPGSNAASGHRQRLDDAVPRGPFGKAFEHREVIEQPFGAHARVHAELLGQ
jgi:hypothetical protein